MLYREAVIWKRLKHANVVPFTGVTFAPLQIVSEWMLGRDLIAYIKSKPQTSRSTLVSPLSNPPRECGLSFPTAGRCCGGVELPSRVRRGSRRSKRGEFPVIGKLCSRLPMPVGEHRGGRRRPRAYNRFRPVSRSGRRRGIRFNIRRDCTVDCT